MTEPTPFSRTLRARCDAAHDGSEHSGFMADLMRGESTREDYTALVAQHWFVYEALEQVAETMREDPIASAFVDDALTRLPHIEADLVHLIGEDWRERIEPLPTTVRYVQRIHEVGAHWAGGFVAHHYTRYLGDLSGGFHIARCVRRHFGLEADGTRFYIFDGIEDPAAFKDRYRAQLDVAAWDDEERERVIDEVLQAYRLNTELFEDLQRAKVATAA